MIEDIFIEKEDLPKPIDFQGLFGRSAETLIVEIGCGKGQFLRSFAQAYPDYDFLGIERFMKWTRHAQARIQKDGLTNIKLLCGLAQDVVSEYLPNESIDQIHVTFPDPWPKRRHHKHRILQKQYIELFAKKLKKGGQFHITTDHKEYFDFALKEFEPFAPDIFQVIQKSDFPFKTNYQIKYEKEGRPIYFFQANKN